MPLLKYKPACDTGLVNGTRGYSAAARRRARRGLPRRSFRIGVKKSARLVIEEAALDPDAVAAFFETHNAKWGRATGRHQACHIRNASAAQHRSQSRAECCRRDRGADAYTGPVSSDFSGNCGRLRGFLAEGWREKYCAKTKTGSADAEDAPKIAA